MIMSIKRKAGLTKTLLVTALLLLLAAGTVQAADGIRLIASEEKDASGEEVTVTISAENAAGSEGGQFILNFDPDLVNPLSVEPGELVTEAASGMHMVNWEYGEGQMMFMWITAAADTEDEGIICTIRFELLNEGETVLEFENLIISPDGMEPADPVSGRITVGATEVGQDEVEEDEIEREEEVVTEDEPEEEEAAVEAVEDGNNYTLVIVLIVLVVLGAAGFMFFKRKRPKSARLS